MLPLDGDRRSTRPRSLGFTVPRWILVAGGALAIAPLIAPPVRTVSVSLPEHPLPALPVDGLSVAGVISVHTEWSHDAVGTIGEVARAARRAGLDFVILGDHPDRHGLGPPTGRVDGVLVVGGREVAVADLGRLTVWGLADPLPGRMDDLASLERLLEDEGAFALVIHGRAPRERERWRGSWIPEGVLGWEVMDVSESARRRQASRGGFVHLLGLVASAPLGRLHHRILALEREPFLGPAAVAYDSIRAERPLTAVAGLNVHPKKRVRGWLVPTFEPFFRTYRNHVLLESPLPDDATTAELELSLALQAGRAHVALGDDPAAADFRLRADRPAASPVSVGERGRWQEGTVLRTSDMGPRILFRVLRDGVELGWASGPWLALPVEEPGVYRVEVHRYRVRARTGYLGLRPWLYANPVELHGPT